jgi:seryl-tRNA synthetase
MEEKISLKFEERMKVRKEILSKIDEDKRKLERLIKKIIDLEKQVKNCEEEKQELEKRIKNHKEKYIESTIPVPPDGDYEICNGLLGMKRDLNLKLVNDLGDEEIIQVFFILNLNLNFII